jgi:RNA-binding protein
MPLTPSQNRYLRGLAHGLKPVIMVGGKGATEAVVAELESALEHHELLKLRLAVDDRDARTALGTELAQRSRAELVQRIGKTVILYRRSRERPRIVLPK